MTKSLCVQMIPPTRLLFTGQQESTRRLFARRPGGTNDWLLVYTQGGRAYFRNAGREFLANADDVVLFRPGIAHDYGLDESHGYWKNRWTHFLPRPECLDWLQWPEFAPGMMCLHLDAPVRDLVQTELQAMDLAVRLQTRRWEELAVNALERALLLCDTVNPRDADNRRDIRIRKAVGLLCQRREEPFTLAELARRCGLSRSRFAELFKRQVGLSPLTFLEMQRLRRARELLEHTEMGLVQIAEEVGFSSPYYLSLRFKKQFGLSPRAYRQMKEG